MMNFLIGFLIAAAVGLTGIGGGSFTVPALVLLARLTAGEAVATSFLFPGGVCLVAAPFYLLGKRIRSPAPGPLFKAAISVVLLLPWRSPRSNPSPRTPLL